MRKISLLIGFVFFFQLASIAQKIDSTTLVKTGNKVPQFSFEIEKGKTVSIKDYEGKVVWINFFATWCGPCRAELPLLHKEVWEKYKNNTKFTVLIFGREEGWQKVTDFKNANQFTFSMLPDENRNIFKLFATQSIPRNVIIDKDGTIVYQSVGFSVEEFKNAKSVLEKL